MGCANWFKRPMGDEVFTGVISLKCDGTVSISQIDSFDWPETLDVGSLEGYCKDAVVKPLPS